MSFSHLPLPPAQEADQVEVPLKSLDGKGVHMCSIDILDPLSVVDYLFNVVQIEISQTDVETYWKHYRSVGSAWAVNHPASNFHVPISLYGDSCKIRTGEKCWVFLQLSIMAPEVNPLWQIFACGTTRRTVAWQGDPGLHLPIYSVEDQLTICRKVAKVLHQWRRAST